MFNLGTVYILKHHMNRFEVRVWDTINKEFIDNEYFRITGNGNVENFVNESENDTNCVITQFTGLCDKNGRKIYEGDIVRKYWQINNTNGFASFEVKYNQQHCGFGIKLGKNHQYEVIGNVFENPELVNTI